MSRLSIAVWGGLAGVTFGTFRSSFPADWGGQVGLLFLVVMIIPPLAWTIEYLHRKQVR